jgi:hypothetical protein
MFGLTPERLTMFGDSSTRRGGSGINMHRIARTVTGLSIAVLGVLQIALFHRIPTGVLAGIAAVAFLFPSGCRSVRTEFFGTGRLTQLGRNLKQLELIT